MLDNSLNVSQIITRIEGNGTVDCACVFFGVDASFTGTLNNGEASVEPPQTHVDGSCSAITDALKPRQTPTIEAVATFIGAGPNPPTYSENFPANGIAQPISKLSLLPLSKPTKLKIMRLALCP